MTKSNEDVVAVMAQLVFLVTGALLLFFSGYEARAENLLWSFILLFTGAILIMIRIEYSKEEKGEGG